MKKSELIELLLKIQGDPQIILSKDAEGNCGSPLDQITDQDKYEPFNSWSGEISDEGQDAVVFWPVN